MKLTPNFDRSEFDAAGIPYPVELEATKLPKLAGLCQWLRNLAGSYGVIASCYRTPEHNAEVGGASASQHMDGEAADVVFPLASMPGMASRVLAAIADGSAPAFGQVIFYPVKGHVHISLPASRLGNRNGQVLYQPSEGVYNTLTAPATQLPKVTAYQVKKGIQLVGLVLVVLVGGSLLGGGAISPSRRI